MPGYGLQQLNFSAHAVKAVFFQSRLIPFVCSCKWLTLVYSLKQPFISNFAVTLSYKIARSVLKVNWFRNNFQWLTTPVTFLYISQFNDFPEYK